MQIIVLGDGMLGTYVYRYLKNKKHYVFNYNRLNFDINNLENYFDYKQFILINCIGLIPQRSSGFSKYDYINVNTVLPHKLQEICEKTDSKLIHVTTDCVFSGARGCYSEKSTHDCLDVYGKTKSLGEPENATVIRTSLIGEELQNKKSLMEWLKANKNGEVKGFINHYWNGITCLQFAKICHEIISKDLFWKGVKHISTLPDVSKLVLLKMISDIYELNVNIKVHKTELNCIRTIVSVRKDIDFDIPTLKDQIIEQRDFGRSIFD